MELRTFLNSFSAGSGKSDKNVSLKRVRRRNSGIYGALEHQLDQNGMVFESELDNSQDGVHNEFG